VKTVYWQQFISVTENKMSQYKLTYFNVRARAELTRLIFAASGVQYEDIRLDSAEWAELKPTAPFGQLPILEVDGVKICQSATLARLLARRFNLAGKTDLDQARADMLIDCYEDTIKPALSFFWDKDEEKKAAAKQKFLEEQLPVSLDHLEKLLKGNNGGDGFLVGDELTWADLGFHVLFGWLQVFGADGEITKRPKLDALRHRIEAVPKIAEWLAKRPKTDM